MSSAFESFMLLSLSCYCPGMPRRLPPLKALKAFEAAARHENFTQAADELCVTQGAVSHQVKALEAELGLKSIAIARGSSSPMPVAVILRPYGMLSIGLPTARSDCYAGRIRACLP